MGGNARQIFLDTETTGLNPEKGDRIVEVAAALYHNQMPVAAEDGGEFHEHLDPQGKKVDPEAFEIHRLSNEFLMGKPAFADIARDLAEFLRGAEIIIHNAAFDVGFLDKEFSRLNMPPLRKIAGKITCSLVRARDMHIGGSHSLDALCQRFEIDIEERKKGHNALLDVRLLAKMYLCLTQRQAEIALSPKLPDVEFNGGDVPVLAATEEELQAHENFLQIMRDETKTEPLYLQKPAGGGGE